MTAKKVVKAKAMKAKPTIGAVAQARLLDGVHQIWLAGLGAVAKAQRGAPKLLDELVAEGAKVHAKARGKAKKAVDAAVIEAEGVVAEAQGAVADARGAIVERIDLVREQATDAYEHLEKVFQARVHRALGQLGVPTADKVAALNKRVDALNANIEKLARARKAAQRTKLAAKPHHRRLSSDADHRARP
jgi:poly(hydroxyalkanoate) granule-associated protein